MDIKTVCQYVWIIDCVFIANEHELGQLGLCVFIAVDKVDYRDKYFQWGDHLPSSK